MKYLFKILPIIIVLFVVSSCEDLEDPAVQKGSETGFLKLGLGLDIESTPAGRTAVVVDLADYKVIIYKADDTEHMVFETYSSIPPEVELETGEYYVVAHSNNEADQAFNNPYYYGRSDNFTIDKEEIKQIDITCTLANCFVTFEYSANVKADFDSWNGSAFLLPTGPVLDYDSSEVLKGYFTLAPIGIDVNLVYNKVFEDSSTIERNLTATIADPQPATHYNVKVDAYLEDGKILINVTVNDEVVTVDIDAAESLVMNGPADAAGIPGGATWADGGGNAIADTKIWNFSDVVLANSTRVWWGVVDGGVKSSMNGATFDDGDPNEVMDFDAAQSDLVNGKLVWMGTTYLPNGTPVYTRFTMTIVNNFTTLPIELVSATYLGLPENVGGVARITSSAIEFGAQFSYEATLNSDLTGWQSHVSLYDANTGAGEDGQSHISMSSGFYWE